MENGRGSVRPATEFDHHDPEFAQDPYPTYRQLRDRGPVTWTEAWGGFWVVSSFRHVVEAARDDATFSSALGLSIPTRQSNMRPLIPIEIDPPEFHKYRRLVNPLFSRPTIARLEGEIRELSVECIEAVVERGECDFVADLAVPMPARMFMRMLGLPEGDWRDHQEWVHTTAHEQFHDFDKGVEAALNVYAAVAEAIDERRDHPGRHEDVIEYLVHTEIDGDRLTDEEILDFCFLLLAGGLDTTTSAISSALLHLADRPEDRRRLAASPELLDMAVEEFLRFEAPVQGLGRVVTRDVEFGGQQLRRGDRVWLLWGAANRDGEEFDRPDEIVLDRAVNRHLSFGIGLHRCLGMHLGRLEFRVALEEVLRRIPDYRLRDGATIRHHRDSSIVFGLEHLQVVFPPRPSTLPGSGE